MWVLAILAALVILGGPPMTFAVKTGVYGRIRDEMQPAVQAVQMAWLVEKAGVPTLTSVEDGAHGLNSLHGVGLAHDWRLRDIPIDKHRRLRQLVEDMLSPDFQVLYEYPNAPKTQETWPSATVHLHVEYDPA